MSLLDYLEKEGNYRIFEGQLTFAAKNFLLKSLYMWVNGFKENSKLSFVDFVDNTGVGQLEADCND